MQFKQAKYRTTTSGRQIDLIVIHDMEAPEKNTTAENVASWFASDRSSRASAHYCVDNDSIVQCVRDQDVAWHAPGANHDGIGVELAGYARQTAAEWRDSYSTQMLEKQAAPLCRALAKKYNVPIRFVDREGLKRGERGFTTHNEVSKAFGRSSHWDPGPNFPMDWFLGVVSGSGTTTVADKPTVAIADGERLLKEGVSGDDVKVWQKLVGVTVDGKFGPKTKAATVKFQLSVGIKGDGIVGPKTRTEMGKVLAWLAHKDNAGSSKDSKPALSGPNAGRPTIKKGSKGDHVSHAQRRLNDHGYNLKIDGDFGPRTDRATRSFQKSQRLTADGIIGPKTWAKLG